MFGLFLLLREDSAELFGVFLERNRSRPGEFRFLSSLLELCLQPLVFSLDLLFFLLGLLCDLLELNCLGDCLLVLLVSILVLIGLLGIRFLLLIFLLQCFFLFSFLLIFFELLLVLRFLGLTFLLRFLGVLFLHVFHLLLSFNFCSFLGLLGEFGLSHCLLKLVLLAFGPLLSLQLLLFLGLPLPYLLELGSFALLLPL